MVAVTVVLIGILLGGVSAECPDTEGLIPWNPGNDPTRDEVIDGEGRLLTGSAVLKSIDITNGGKLVIEDKGDAGMLMLTVNHILIQRGGELHVGGEDCPYRARLMITLTGRLDDGEPEVPGFGKKFIGVAPTGSVEIHGKIKTSWSLLDGTLQSGGVDENNQTIITLADDVTSWEDGDSLVIASSDRDMNHAETFQTVTCTTCNANQVRIQGYPAYTHYGEISDGIDMRAEVGMLSHNIMIMGRLEDECYGDDKLCEYFDFDIFGGQTQVLIGFTTARFEGIEFHHMGQQGLGNYPVHFHRVGNAVPGTAYARHTSVHHSLSRCYVVHDAQNIEISDNVAYDALGHCYFLEDGSEYNNTLRHNLGLVTKAGSLLPSDRSAEMCQGILDAVLPPYVPDPTKDCLAVSTFWLTHPDNIIDDNSAAGSEEYGFFYVFHREPTGPSAGRLPPFHGERSPLTSFANNRAHSNANAGLFLDRGVKVDDASPEDPREFLAMMDYAQYMPHVDRDPLAPRVPAVIDNFTSYKDHIGAHFRGGDVFISNSKFGDDDVGVTTASSGTLPYDSGSRQQVDNCYFNGKTANAGSDPINTWYPQRGVEIRDGPVVIEDCTFDNFPADSDGRSTSAVGFYPNNTGQSSPGNTLRRLTFDAETQRVWFGATGGVFAGYDSDGDRTQLFHDADGSVSGQSGAYIVRADEDILTESGCTENAQWGGAICTGHQYGQVYLNASTKELTLTVVRRTGQTNKPYQLKGANRNNTGDYPDTTSYQPVLVDGQNYNFHWDGVAPARITVSNHNFNQNGWSGIGLCYPPETTFNVTYDEWDQMRDETSNERSMTQGNSIADVDNDPDGYTFFWDATSRLLHLKTVRKYASQGYHYCPPEGCERIHIEATIINSDVSDCRAL